MENIENMEKLGILPLRNMVLFPGVMIGITVTRESSKQLVKDAFASNRPIAVCCQKKKETATPKGEDLYLLGTAARVVRLDEQKDHSLQVVIQGEERIELSAVVEDNPFRTGTDPLQGYS